MTAPVDPYRTLGLPRDAPLLDVKRAYRRLAKLHHPDSAGPAALLRLPAHPSLPAGAGRRRGREGDGAHGQGWGGAGQAQDGVEVDLLGHGAGQAVEGLADRPWAFGDRNEAEVAVPPGETVVAPQRPEDGPAQRRQRLP